MAPTPRGDEMGPAESGYEESKTVAQIDGAHPWPVIARTAAHSAAPRTGLFEATREMLRARVPCIFHVAPTGMWLFEWVPDHALLTAAWGALGFGGTITMVVCV